MSLHFHWFLPTNGDGRDIVGGGHGVATGSAGAVRPASLGYLGQIARSAEQLGFEAALTPTGAWCEDAWLATGMLTEVTERLKFLVAFRPGLVSPTLAAQMAATFQRYSPGRLLLNVVTGGEAAEQQAYGDFLGKAQRYQRCAEFLDIVTRLWGGETVSHDGEHLRVAGARLSRRSEGQRRMRQLHGGSPDSLEVSPNLWAGVGLLRGGAGTALVATPRSPTGSRSTPRSASPSSSCPGTRTWRRSTGSARECCPSCASAAAGSIPHQRARTAPSTRPRSRPRQVLLTQPPHRNSLLAERPAVLTRTRAQPNPEVDVMRIAVVTGNPKPASRTHGVALAVAGTLAAALAGPGAPFAPGAPGAHLVVDLSEHAPSLFDSSAAELSRLTAEVAAADIAIFASPTYEASYTGMLKAFLDRYGSNGLAGTIAVPVMTGGWAGHSLAVEVHLRPVLVELGATVPTRGLYVTEPELPELDAAIARWAATAIPLIRGALAAHEASDA